MIGSELKTGRVGRGTPSGSLAPTLEGIADGGSLVRTQAAMDQRELLDLTLLRCLDTLTSRIAHAVQSEARAPDGMRRERVSDARRRETDAMQRPDILYEDAKSLDDVVMTDVTDGADLISAGDV